MKTVLAVLAACVLIVPTLISTSSAMGIAKAISEKSPIVLVQKKPAGKQAQPKQSCFAACSQKGVPAHQCELRCRAR